jgi:membrane protease YdiL (CAAX protease family)
VAAQTVAYKTKEFESRNLMFFFLIVFGLNAIMWLIATIFNPGKPTSLADLSIFFWALVVIPAAIGPTLAAFLMTAITEGKPGVKALWGRFWNRNLNLKWLLIALLGFDLMKLIANLIVRMIDGQPYPIINTYTPIWMTIPLFLSTFISSGMGEEFGWRGYVLPRFQAKWNALTSSIILGILWAAWHIPAFIIPNVSPLYQQNYWEWLPMVLLYTFIFTWIFNNSKGSVLAAAILHATMNTSLVVLPTYTSGWLYYGLLLLVIILIVVVFGPKNFVRQQPEGTT